MKKVLWMEPWLMNTVMAICVLLNFGAVVSSLMQQSPVYFILTAPLCLAGFIAGWIGKGLNVIRGDWESREVQHDLNILLGRLIVDLIECGPNGDILAVYRKHRFIMDRLALDYPKHAKPVGAWRPDSLLLWRLNQ